MIQKLLNKLGYFKEEQVRDLEKDPFTPEELGFLYAQTLGDVTEYTIEPKQEKELFEKLRKIEGLFDYLRATTAKDIQRYFMASSDSQREAVKGALGRTIYFKNKVSGAPHKETVTKLKGLRYGK